MRILFDSCVYDLRNKGNVAMLQTAINRIHDYWPEASLEVITSAPYLLRLYCPNARPISPTGADYWSEHRDIIHVLFQKMPIVLLRFILELREAVWQRSKRNELEDSPPQTDSRKTSVQDVSQVPESGHAADYYNSFDPETLRGMDLYVATGGHYLTDIMNADVLAVLERLELATQMGIPTVMVGQGVGPVKDPHLLVCARAVLPKVDLFLVREDLEAPGILSGLGVDASRIFVTGDDAVEMAYQMSSRNSGTSIGVGFRVAHTTEANSRHMDVLRKVFKRSTTKHHCQLVGLPVSQSAHELDQKIIESISAGSRYRRSFLQRLNPPKRIMKDTALCRVVVTGTYHTAVFALAQGIPVIGLVKSSSYLNKFNGLADQYKGGMTVFQLDDELLSDKVFAAIDRAWESADSLRPSLREVAKHQIISGHNGYELIYQVQQRKHEYPRMVK